MTTLEGTENRPDAVAQLVTGPDGNAHVRFLHASPDAPAVDITLPDGTVLFGDIEFKEVGDYLPVPAGMYDLEARLAGTDTVVLNVDGVQLDNQFVYTVYATGFAGGGDPPLNAVISIDYMSEGDPTDVSLSAIGGAASTSTIWFAAGLAVLMLAGIAGIALNTRRQ